MAESSSAGGRKRGRPVIHRETPDPQPARREPAPLRYCREATRPDTVTDTDPIPALSAHPLLDFEPGTRPHTYLARIISLEPHQPRSFDWRLLEELGIRGRLEELLDARWRHFLAADGPQYQVLTLEFLSTFEHHLGPLDDPYAIVFSLGRRLHHMSISQFAVHMGLYTEEEVTQPIFTESLRGVMRADSPIGLTVVQLSAFWTTIADGSFQPTTPASQIRDPLLRFLHRVIACTVVGRFMGIEKVNTQDLFILCCLVERRPANLATILLASLTRPRGRGEHSRLALGSYIGRLATSLGIFDTWPARILHEGPTVVRIPYTDMQQMGVCPLHGPRGLVEARAPIPIDIPEGARPEDAPPSRQRHTAQPRQRAVPRVPPPPPPPPAVTLDRIWEELADQRAFFTAELAEQRQLLQRLIDHFQIPPPPPQ